jgi:hypothetical protein
MPVPCVNGFFKYGPLRSLYKFSRTEESMVKIHKLSDREKELLTALGDCPDASIDELLTHTTYKRKTSILRKLDQLREQNLFAGPVYWVDFGKLCRNPLHRIFCTVETNLSHETVISYLTLIDSLVWIFPVLSPYKNVLNVQFFSSHDEKTRNLLQLLKDKGIITDFVARVSRSRRNMENPDLFGDVNPSLDTLLEPCELPLFSPGCHDTVWNECDIRVLRYLITGYKEGNFIEILRAERRSGHTLTYDQVKNSRKKMVENELIEKKYSILPFPYTQCVHFILFVNLQNTELTPRVLYNFARGARVYKEYILCKDWGYMECASHPQFLTGLMHKLDSIDQIKRKELYHIRSLSSQYVLLRPPEFGCYTFDEQTLEYPYSVYEERIKENIENE